MKSSHFYAMAIAALLASCKEKTPVQAPPPEVKVVVVEMRDVDLEKDFVAHIFGQKDIPIRARVEGFLTGIHFKEGTMVRKGALLYSVDQDQYMTSVNAAKSELAEANVALIQAESDLERYIPLAEMNAISKKDLDAAQAKRDGAIQRVKAAQAKLDYQNIQLSYTKMQSPVDGLIGKTQARIGEFVGREPNPVILNTISIIDTLRVEFYLSENDYLSIFKSMLEEGHIERDKKKTYELILADGTTYSEKGKIEFINREIDSDMGTITISAIFPNPQRMLRPGQFARIRVPLNEVKDAKLIPQRAVTEIQGQSFVYVVGEGNKLSRVLVNIEGVYKDYFVVSEGLNEGDKLVLEAVQRVAEGMLVSPVVAEFQSKMKN